MSGGDNDPTAVSTPTDPPERRPSALGRRRQNLSWATVFELLVLATSTATFILVTKPLGPAQYGDYAAIQAIVVTASTLVSSWTGFVLIERVIREHCPLNDAVSGLLPLVISVAPVAFLVSCLVGTALMPRVGISTLASFLLAALVGNTLLQLATAALQAVQGFASAARFLVIARVAQFGAVLALWLARAITLESLGYATLTASMLAGMLAMGWAIMHAGLRLELTSRIVTSHVSRALAYAMTLLAAAAEEDADKILLVALTSSSVAGIYAAGYRIVQLGLVPLRAGISALHNEFVSHNDELSRQHVRRSIALTSIAACYGVAATIALFFAAPLVPHVLGSSYRHSIAVVRFVSPLVILRCLSSFAFNGLMGLGRRFWRLAVLGVAAAINVMLNFILIPMLSWRGAALALLASEIVYAILVWLALVILERRADESRRLVRATAIESSG